MIELKNKVLASESTKEIWRKKRSSNEWNDASKLNRFLFGVPLNNAPKCECLEDLFLMLRSKNINQKIKSKMSKEFILMPKKVLQTSKFGVITEASSDEKCMRMLNAFPVNAKHFKSLPENWEQKCSDFVNGKTKGVNPMIDGGVVDSKEGNSIEEVDIEPVVEVREINDTVDLDSLKVSGLKKYIASKGVEVPNGNKAALLEFAKTL